MIEFLENLGTEGGRGLTWYLDPSLEFEDSERKVSSF